MFHPFVDPGALPLTRDSPCEHGEAAFAVGDRVQFTDTLKGAGIYL